MESPKSLNGITRTICNHDINFVNQKETIFELFFKNVKPFVLETLEFLKGKPIKLKTTFYHDSKLFSVIYPMKIQDYDLEKVKQLILEKRKPPKSTNFLLVQSIIYYTPELKFIETSNSENEFDSDRSESPIFTLNPRKWFEDDYDSDHNMYFY